MIEQNLSKKISIASKSFTLFDFAYNQIKICEVSCGIETPKRETTSLKVGIPSL